MATVLAIAGTWAAAASIAPSPAPALETFEAQMQASDAASRAAFDMFQVFGFKQLKPGQYLWRDVPDSAGPERVVISIGDQLAYLYRGNSLVAVSTISSGKDEKPTPTGVFSILGKKPMYRSRKYDNAPMPFAQFITDYGVALHAGYNPGYAASHGCIRLPSAFAKKLYSITSVGTPVYVGA
jgi:lipoprotein-anchoring transpeptidase ErfK/SrfK